MATVYARPNESAERLIKRFRRKVSKSGILTQVRRKRWHMTKSEVRRLARKKAIRRLRRRERKRRERERRRRF